MKVSVQVQQAVKKANGLLAFITRGVEYCVQFWSPNLRKAILAIEGVQRGFTMLIPGMA